MSMKDLRRRSGKTAEQIAVEIGVSVSTVRNWDQSKMMPRMTPLDMQKLMTAYGCNFNDLVSAEIKMIKSKPDD